MIATGILAAFLHLRKRLFDTRWFQLWCMAMTPSGFMAVLAGWFVTEIGRQPFIIQGIMRTSEAVSPVAGQTAAISLTAFLFVYTFIFGGGVYYILSLIAKGPSTQDRIYGDHGVKRPPLLSGLIPGQGGGDV
jgi:cytochrome d ubiquinol oxidase subunit I